MYFCNWEIFVNGISKGFVRALTENDARNQYYMKYGGASRYSGIGMNNIKAVKV